MNINDLPAIKCESCEKELIGLAALFVHYEDNPACVATAKKTEITWKDLQKANEILCRGAQP